MSICILVICIYLNFNLKFQEYRDFFYIKIIDLL